MAAAVESGDDDIGVSGDSAEEENDGTAEDFDQYVRHLGLDPARDEDMMWIAHEAFAAALPPNWSEHTDETGRYYFFNRHTEESTWAHPMDSTFREIIELVQKLRAEVSSEDATVEAVNGHLQGVHTKAMASLQGWSGPYVSEAEGVEYYYNDARNVSTWESPVAEWENDLFTRYSVLYRALLPDKCGALANTVMPDAGSAGLDLFTRLQLPLQLVTPPADDAPRTPSTSRSFHTARSACSARSGRQGGQEDPSTTPSRRHRDRSPPAPAARQGDRDRSPKPPKGSGGARSPRTRSPRSKGEAQGDDDDALEITFGRTDPLKMPIFGSTRS